VDWQLTSPPARKKTTPDLLCARTFTTIAMDDTDDRGEQMSTENEFLVALPKALTDDPNYRVLNTRERHHLQRRLETAWDIMKRAEEAAQPPRVRLPLVVDEIERFVLAIVHGEPGGALAPCLIHATWVFDCDRDAMHGQVPADVAAFLAAPLPHLDAAGQAASHAAGGWLGDWAQALDQTLDHFTRAPDFTAVVACLVVVDALAALLLAFAATLRLATSAKAAAPPPVARALPRDAA